MSIKNPRQTRELRKQLRKEMTNAESLLWEKLRKKQLYGLRVKRQYGIGPYVLDFYMPKLNLAIEVDGGIHLTSEVKQKDKNRDAFLNQNGIEVIRIRNEDVFENLEDILVKLRAKVKSMLRENPNP